MKIDVYPSMVSGSITPPPSKSILHRSIISACLAVGKSTINNVVLSEDIKATINAFVSLGVNINTVGSALVIESKGYSNFNANVDIDCNESGSTIRFLIPILSNVNDAYFRGKSGLIKRPFNIYETIFKDSNLIFEKTSSFIRTKGKLKSGKYVVPGNVSSQFISGLLFVLPLLDGDSSIEIEGVLESANYVDITIDVLSIFGIRVKKTNNSFIIKGNQNYINNDINVETDYSQLAFFAVLGIINNSITINNINPQSLQPDKAILNIIEEMGGKLIFNDNSVKLKKSFLHNKIIDVSQSPDIAPILGILCAYANGTSQIINAKRLLIKESNRLKSTYEILKLMGVDVVMKEDSLIITGPKQFNGGIYDSFNDHRIAMTLAIAATIAKEKITILNAETINKSYPNFYKDLQSLGVEIKYR